MHTHPGAAGASLWGGRVGHRWKPGLGVSAGVRHGKEAYRHLVYRRGNVITA